MTESDFHEKTHHFHAACHHAERIPEDCEDLLDGMVIWPDNMDTEKWYYLAVQEATNSHDYGRKMSGYEFWTVLREVRDWTVYEK